MKTSLFIALLISLTACASSKIAGMQFTDQSPGGITVINIIKEERVKAYRSAEAHCSKYTKVPRMIKSITHDELDVAVSTMKFECIRPTTKNRKR